MSLASDLVRNYIELRTTQRQVRLMREDIAALQDRAALLQARVEGGVLDHTDLQRQRAELAALRAQLPPLLAQETASANQIALLMGERPGALQAELAPRDTDAAVALPDLALGLPSEVAQRRPDIRAAEARLRSATASIGIAKADLYPSIRLGAKFGYESYLSGEFSDWGSRAWSIGPSLNLPIFDHGRRKATVQLRELQQQEAAINYQQAVLRAWQEIDDALSSYGAEQRQARELQTRSDAAADAYQLAKARYDGGITDFTRMRKTRVGFVSCGRVIQVDRQRFWGQASLRLHWNATYDCTARVLTRRALPLNCTSWPSTSLSRRAAMPTSRSCGCLLTLRFVRPGAWARACWSAS